MMNQMQMLQQLMQKNHQDQGGIPQAGQSPPQMGQSALGGGAFNPNAMALLNQFMGNRQNQANQEGMMNIQQPEQPQMGQEKSNGLNFMSLLKFFL